MTCPSRFCKGIGRVSKKSKVVPRLLRNVSELNAVNCLNMDPGTNACFIIYFPRRTFLETCLALFQTDLFSFSWFTGESVAHLLSNTGQKVDLWLELGGLGLGPSSDTIRLRFLAKSSHLLKPILSSWGCCRAQKWPKWWRNFVNQKVSYTRQLLLQRPMGGSKINKSPFFRVYRPKRKIKSHGFKQGAYLQSMKNFLCQGLPHEEGWFQAAGVMREDFLKEKSTHPCSLSLGQSWARRAASWKNPKCSPRTSWIKSVGSYRLFLLWNPDSRDIVWISKKWAPPTPELLLPGRGTQFSHQ